MNVIGEAPSTTAVKTLGTWLADADRNGYLLRVRVPTDAYGYEATAILRQLEREQSAPPVLFERPVALTGGPSPYRLLFNLYGDPACIAASLGRPGCAWPELLELISEQVTRDVDPQPTEDVPVQAIVTSGDDVDIREIPFVRHIEMEGGPYLTPTIVSRGADGRYNLSWNRCMYLDPQHVAVHMSPRHLWLYQQQAEQDGRSLPIAIVLGHHPLFNQAAASLVATTRDEYAAAGGLLGAPARIASSVSFGTGLMVPADAEAVIEAEILPRRRTLEGPFGEYMRYLGPEKLSHVARVRAVTRRPEPTITEVFAAHADHLNACIALEASFLGAARAAVPSVVSTSWFHGGGPTTVVIALRKLAEGLPMRAALAVIAASNMVKQVIVVDEDIDPRDPHEVLWAVSTRTQADRDITILNGLQGSVLDPSLGSSLSTSGFVIDATKPLDRPYPSRAQVPADALRRFPLDRYLEPTAVAQARRALRDARGEDV